MAFLWFFCILIFDQNKRHKGLVCVIKQNGHMLPLSWCARNKNSTLFLYQTRWLLFFTFSWTPCMYIFQSKNDFKSLNLIGVSFIILNFSILGFTWLWFHSKISILLQMAAFWKKGTKKGCFTAQQSISCIFENVEKMLDFERL